ncbi:MAG: SMC-Scp complex subunit ScpB [Candidatus Komeilibacteria bacterium]
MSLSLSAQIESLLLVATKPLKLTTLKKILTTAKAEEIQQALADLQYKYNQTDSGFRLLSNQDAWQLSTAPEAAELVKDFVKDETTGELTKPSLETLTIIAYRQPITKAELEQIRGVNCSMILRNLQIRGLVASRENKQRMVTEYLVTMDFLKFMGINNVKELPDFDKLNNDTNLRKLLGEDIVEDPEQNNGDNATDDSSGEDNEDDSGGADLPGNDEVDDTIDKANESSSGGSVSLPVNIYS